MKWMPIETAPKDGQRIILARYSWLWWDGGADVGSREWVKYVMGEALDRRREYTLCWLCSGFWSEKWNNWNDGVEPSGLNQPTHWMPLLEPPQEKDR